MDRRIYDNYVQILHSELVPALGCTEPIAIAYAAAKATEVLGTRPEHLTAHCSGNVIKNVQGVVVPNSGGLKGIEAAAILGALGGDAGRELEVLQDVKPEAVAETSKLLGTGYCTCRLAEGVANLYILVQAERGSQRTAVEIENRHTHISRIWKNDEIIFQDETFQTVSQGADKDLLNLRDILSFADEVDLADVRTVLDDQIAMNMAISREGLHHSYGACVGQTLLSAYGDDVKVRACAMAAAGSDARMSGCPLPVVINSGSGNQGMAASLPVIEYAKELKVEGDKLYRALVVSNLVALHQKRYIGSLSAYCGAVCAACGSGAAITYLYGGDYEQISKTIINTIANVGGIVCDGAKPSCAAKIASAVDAAILAHHMSAHEKYFKSGEGLVQEDVEKTIENLGYVGRVGMKSTDEEILKIMLGEEPGGEDEKE
jgi:L-cysteine desulfidase